MQSKHKFNELPNKLNTGNSQIEYKLAEEGVSGTYFITENNLPLGVFKDSAQDPLCPDNHKLMPQAMQFGLNFINTEWFFTAFDHCVTGQSYVSDYLSYILAKEIQLDYTVVPKTQIIDNVSINGELKHGSLLKWIPNALSLETCNNFFRKLTDKPDVIPFEAFEEMAMFDYITGNMDRKAGNLLIREDDAKLYLIDNSWAFSPLQGESLSMNHFAWGNFPLLAERTFSETIKLKIDAIHKRRYEYARIAFNTYCQFSPPGETVEISYQRAMCFLHRIEMIYFLICQKNATFNQLSQVRFEDTFLQIHKPYAQTNPFLSSHFIDFNTENLTLNGIQSKPINSPIDATPAEKRLALLFNPCLKNQSALTHALIREVARLNEKQASRNWSGLWRNRYKQKADNVNIAFEQIIRDSQSDHELEDNIALAIQNKNSNLYKALNTHTSFTFNFTLDSLNTDTQAIYNLKNVKYSKPVTLKEPGFNQIQELEYMITDIDQFNADSQSEILGQYTSIKIKQYLFWKENTFQLLDGETGIKRANFYLDAFQQKSYSLFHKQLMLYALLTSPHGIKLKTQIGHVDKLKTYLMNQLHERINIASGGDTIKKQEYLKKINNITNKISSHEDTGKISKSIINKIDFLENKLSSKPNLVKNILDALSRMDLNYGGHEHESKRLILDILNDQDNNHQLSDIIDICKQRTSLFTSTLSHFSLFGWKKTRDPQVDLLLRSLAQFEKNKIYNPYMETLADLISTQQNRDNLQLYDRNDFTDINDKTLPDINLMINTSYGQVTTSDYKMYK